MEEIRRPRTTPANERCRRRGGEEICFKGCAEEEERLEPRLAKTHLSVGALLNYLAPDRPEAQYAIKEVMRRASAPVTADWARLKSVGRFIVGEPRQRIHFEWQARSDMTVAFVDSDFAGCMRTRKSTAGGCILRGAHCIKSWAKTLPILALSTGEAELMSVVRGTAELLGVKSLYGDLGLTSRLELRSDATAAIGIVSRAGLGKVRHLSVADLWVQQVARRGDIGYSKVAGSLNPADMFTKPVDATTMGQHWIRIGLRRGSGRAACAPQRRTHEPCGDGGAARGEQQQF